MPGTSFAIEKARLVRPGTVALLLFEVLPRPLTGTPVSSVTVKLTTGGLLMVTLVTLTFIESAAHAAAAASVAGVALLGTETTGVLAPGGPAGPVSVLHAARTRAAAVSIALFTRWKAFIERSPVSADHHFVASMQMQEPY